MSKAEEVTTVENFDWDEETKTYLPLSKVVTTRVITHDDPEEGR